MEDQRLSELDKGSAPVGTWSHISYQEKRLILEKGQKLEDNTYGYRLFSNGSFRIRQAPFFCA